MARSGQLMSALRASALSAAFIRQSGLGAPRRGVDRSGEVVLGMVRCGNRCRRQHWGLRLPLLLSLESRCGTAWSGRVSYGEVKSDELGSGIVKGCRQQYGGFALPTVLSGTGLAWRCEFWNGFMGHG